MTVLITGGAGYVGSHIAHLLVDLGIQCVALDDLSRGIREAVPVSVPLVVGKISDKELVRRTIRKYQVVAVMHLAGSVVIAESLRESLTCYRNNVYGTISLLEACVSAGVLNVIFASSAAVYGTASGGNR